MRSIEVQVRRSWSPLGPNVPPPEVGETKEVVLRGLNPGDPIALGPVTVIADASGQVRVRLFDNEHLTGHVGLLPIGGPNGELGEISIVPEKISQPAYEVLRADLQRTWSDLALDPDGVTSVSAGPPPAHQLWSRIARPIAGIQETPSEVVVPETQPRRLAQVRRVRELRPALLRAGQQGRGALTTVLERTVDTPENHLCARTLFLLRNHARRTDPDLVPWLDNILTDPLFFRADEPVTRVTWGMRSDRRYSAVLAVYRILNRPELAATEGPGELRLGVRALPRLYEYWVYLQVLVAATRRYGPPLGDGFASLATRVSGGRTRLELVRGTTIEFPGRVHIAFEPEIRAAGTGWMGLENVPFPLAERAALNVTPDVVVLRLSGKPEAVVIDAKYVARHFVETEAAKLHQKYARMRLAGVPVVANVLAAHPHDGLENQWAGYGHVRLRPDAVEASSLVEYLPSIVRLVPPSQSKTRAAVVSSHRPEPSNRGSRGRPGLTIVADQFWMTTMLGSRRIDLGDLRDLAAAGRPVSESVMVMPRISQLMGFARAVEGLGWRIHWVESAARGPQIEALVHVVQAHGQVGRVVVVSGDPSVLAQLDDECEQFRDLDSVPDNG